jgi:hypothetical protein
MPFRPLLLAARARRAATCEGPIITRGRLLAFAPVQPLAQIPDLCARLLQLFLQRLFTFDGPLVLGFPERSVAF